MKKRIAYNFKDFTTQNYKKIIRVAKKQYQFRLFNNYRWGSNYILLWRHDIDFSVHRAAKLAEIESKEGIKATYFILLHSEFYNLLEKETSYLIKKIITLGHDIGIHFDTHYYDLTNETELETYLDMEKEFLEKIFHVKISSFSFHINDVFTQCFTKDQYAGLTNVYSSFFKQKAGYCSDSNGYWRFRKLINVLRDRKDKCLQVLTHPGLWQDKEMSPRQRIWRAIEGRAKKTKLWYNQTLKQYGRKNIG